ncbi:hypothetical protein B5M09_005984 [Aphanomyces astaci]|uniref:CN hydrolase domain-containing protein n=1 Tax=Aphanomyces astaci TaxID=112090 RepID=A0A3R7WGC3_APHAT|nr:hypothetical protein B5M09_005984 [Aphanomyces astaci]
MACAAPEANIKKAETLVRIAHQRGAQIVLLQELFQHTYFPIELSSQNFHLADTLESSGILRGMQALAKELSVVLPISFFERYKHSYYNSVAVIDADGSILGVVRKAHISGTVKSILEIIPMKVHVIDVHSVDRLGYNDKYYFTPSDDPVPVFHTVSRHVGTEESDGVQVTFCGSSFITGNTGELLKIADRDSEGVLVDTLPLGKFHIRRASWGLLRDRRPHLYKGLLTRDGSA